MKGVIVWLGIYLSICYAMSTYSPIASPKPDTCASAFEAQYLTVKHVDGHSLFCQNKHFQLCWDKAANFLKKNPLHHGRRNLSFLCHSHHKGHCIHNIMCRCIFWSLGRHQRKICGKYSGLTHPHTYTWFGMMLCFPLYHSILPSYWWIVAWQTPCIYF